MYSRELPPVAGFMFAINNIDKIIENWEINSQLLLLPRIFVSQGVGIWSIRGAHINLNEYPNAAQLNIVTADFFKPASFSQSESDEKINKIGMPAEKPSNNMMNTFLLKYCSIALIFYPKINVFILIWLSRENLAHFNLELK